VAEKSRQEEVALGAEFILDWFHAFVADKDDDELVFMEAPVKAMAEACNVPQDEIDALEIAPETAGEFRRRFRAAKEHLARGEGP
jgi:hypothetical protein